jgi:arylsulfatase A-like enzyme
VLAWRINARVPASLLGPQPRLAMIVGLAVILGLTWGHRAKSDAYVPDVRSTSKDKPHVIMIVLDALRWDRLSVYGHPRTTSPNIDRLAEEGVVFLQAHSHGPRTAYSMPSLFTSLYPSLHGMAHYRDLLRPLATERTTIAEVLKEDGYRTAAVITNFYVGDGFQMTQGFDLTEQFGKLRQKLSLIWTLTKLDLIAAPYHTTHWKAEAHETTEAALRWLHRLEDAPMFLYVHYMDTHHVYLPPRDVADKFLEVENAPDPQETFARADRYKKQGEPIEEADMEALKSYYDACIYHSDREIGRILEEARRLSAERETIVIITSDHGDEFLEHGDVFHTNMAFEELIHVPMIFWDPHRYGGGKRVSEIVRHIDVMPTIAEITGSSLPDEAAGRSLEPLLLRGEDYTVESVAEGPFNVSINSSVWKAIYNDTLDTYFIFDLLDDPVEQTNLWSPDANERSGLRLRLDEYIRATANIEHGRSTGLDADSRRQLKALGYL